MYFFMLENQPRFKVLNVAMKYSSGAKLKKISWSFTPCAPLGVKSYLETQPST